MGRANLETSLEVVRICARLSRKVAVARRMISPRSIQVGARMTIDLCIANSIDHQTAKITIKRRRLFLPAIRILIRSTERLLSNTHLHIFGEGKKLLGDIKNVLMLEREWRVHQIRKSDRRKNFMQLRRKALKLFLRGTIRSQRAQVDNGQRREGCRHDERLVWN